MGVRTLIRLFFYFAVDLLERSWYNRIGAQKFKSTQYLTLGAPAHVALRFYHIRAHLSREKINFIFFFFFEKVLDLGDEV